MKVQKHSIYLAMKYCPGLWIYVGLFNNFTVEGNNISLSFEFSILPLFKLIAKILNLTPIPQPFLLKGN